MTGSILLYGATGYTGRLIAREARAMGAGIVLAGRNPNKLKAIARQLDLPWRAFDLADRARLEAALKDSSVVLNAAGPFSSTARPMADACLREGTHYLDITGEIDVFEALFARDAAFLRRARSGRGCSARASAGDRVVAAQGGLASLSSSP